MPENTVGSTAEIRVCMPLYRSVLPQTFSSIWQLSQSSVCLDMELSADVSTSRNNLVERLDGEPYLLFVDGDMVFSSQQIEELYFVLKENPDMGALAAHACTWGGNQTPVCGWRVPGTKNDWLDLDAKRERALEFVENMVVAPVDMFGTGVVMINTKVFRKLPKPWFDFNRKMGWGEDTNFCQRMIAAGYRPCVHFGVSVGHIGPTLWMPDGAKSLEMNLEKEGMAQIAV